MKLKNLFLLLCMIAVSMTLTQCEKGNPGNGMGTPDPDSDRPDWAGGNTGENPHNKQGDGGTNGGNTVDYGDLYVLNRNDDGVPILTEIEVEDEEGNYLETIYVVQPIAEDGRLLLLDAEGGLLPEELEFAQPVDFGRLNIVRSPQSVLDQALGEALKVIRAGEEFSVDFCGRLTIWNTVEGVLTVTKTIDSPRESMALYQELMNHQFNDSLLALVGSGIDPFALAASCFAAGSDKTGTVNIDEVVYINGFMGNYGCDPLINTNEEDKYNEWEWKHYFNFGNCACDGKEFTYNRILTYQNRYLQFYDYINGEYIPNGDPVSVLDAMEDRGLFMYRAADNGATLTHVEGFAAAIDDAVQVLEFVHGNSNIGFVY